MTSTRNELCAAKDTKETKTEKIYMMRLKSCERISKLVPTRIETTLVTMWLYVPPNPDPKWWWWQVPFLNFDCVGFEVEENPFGKVT
jgi:hypothetical protein